MADLNDNMEDAMLDIINTGTATQYADGDDHNQDVDDGSQYLALEMSKKILSKIMLARFI
jgi:hypothetical protein